MTAGARPTVSLRAEGVAKSYRRGSSTVHAVVDATLDLVDGTMTALVGPSGSGKSTLLNMLVGWESPDGGTVDPPVDAARPDWQRLAIVPQSLGLLDELSIGENILLASRFGAALVDVDAVVDHLGLDALLERLPRETSLGEQQRTSVARAVVARPQLLVADEPTSHQDERSTDRVIEVLGSVARAGGAVLVATHDRRVVAACDRVIEMSDGHVTTTLDDPGARPPGMNAG